MKTCNLMLILKNQILSLTSRGTGKSHNENENSPTNLTDITTLIRTRQAIGVLLTNILELAVCPQCYCGEIRQMLTFLINLYCLKAYHRPHNSIRIVNIIQEIITIIIIPKTNIITATRTQGRFRVCDLSSCNLLFETNNFGLGAVLLSCLVSELQEPSSSGLELRTLFRSSGISIFSSWSQGIIMPSLVQIGVSILQL
jgi:hypothetical protein